MRRIWKMIGTAAALAMLALPLAAQDEVAPTHPWAAFFGCWAPIDGTRAVALTCVLPTADSPFAAELASVVGESVVRTTTVRADGARQEIEGSCTGYDVAAFSDDAARVYTKGSARCVSAGEQITTGVLSITPDGHLLRVTAVRVGEQRTVTTQRMGLMRVEDVPRVMQARVAGLSRLADGARTLAAQPVRIPVIEEMLGATDEAVVEAWMAETRTGLEPLRLTRQDLVRMDAREVPTRIIDLAVVLANPQQFEPRITRVAQGGMGGGAARSFGDTDPFFSRFCDGLHNGMAGNFPGWAPMMYPGLGLSYYSWYPACLGRAGYFGWWSPFGFNRFGGWFGGPWVGGAVPVTVTTAPVTSRGPGTVTKGNGYGRSTQDSPSGGTASPRGGSGTGTVTAAPSSGSGSSSAGVRSAGDGGSGRTAKPRNP